jgi:hypothetical protein
MDAITLGYIESQIKDRFLLTLSLEPSSIAVHSRNNCKYDW